MKYSQACQVKTVVDRAINALERAIWDRTADAAARKQLAAMYVSRLWKWLLGMADTSRRKTGKTSRSRWRTCVGPGTPRILTRTRTMGKCDTVNAKDDGG